jgi:hypothetical protein
MLNCLSLEQASYHGAILGVRLRKSPKYALRSHETAEEISGRVIDLSLICPLSRQEVLNRGEAPCRKVPATLTAGLPSPRRPAVLPGTTDFI